MHREEFSLGNGDRLVVESVEGDVVLGVWRGGDRLLLAGIQGATAEAIARSILTATGATREAG